MFTRLARFIGARTNQGEATAWYNFGPELDRVDLNVQQLLMLVKQILTQEAKLATEAQVQAAVDAIVASLVKLSANVTAEDSAISAVLKWVQDHPGTIPDALVTELANAQATVDSVATDIKTQTDSLVAGTPGP